MLVSIVTTLYRSEPFIREFYQRSCKSLEQLGLSYEFIFVNDGSPDASFNIAINLMQDDGCVKVVDLSRNFGHHEAILVGLRESSGDYVFLIDVDLEEPPETLEEFFSELNRAPDTDVVYGVWHRHGEGRIRHGLAWIYYTLFNALSEHAIPRNVLLTRLMTRRYVNALVNAWTWPTPPIQLMTMIGFRQIERPVSRTYKGYTSYSLMKRLKLAANAITSYSTRPLQVIFFLGVTVMILSLVMMAYAIAGYMSSGQTVDGWYSVFASLWFLGGLTMMSLGIAGHYIGRIFNQVNGRAQSVVRHVYLSTPELNPLNKDTMGDGK